MWGGLRKGTVASACLSVWEKAVPQLFDARHFLPVWHWCLSSCYPERVSLSKSVCGFLKRNCLTTPEISSTDSVPAGLCSQKLWGLIFMVLVPWARGPGGPGGRQDSLLSSWIILLTFQRERGEGREKERERNINVWLPLTHSHGVPGLQPRHVTWLGIEPATLWFTDQHWIHWATPARA